MSRAFKKHMYRRLLKIGIFLQVPLKKGIQLLKSGLEKFVEKKIMYIVLIQILENLSDVYENHTN